MASDINSIADLDTLTEAFRLQQQFHLSEPPDSWIEQFILQLFDLFFLPFILTIFFLILTSGYLEAGFRSLVPNDFIRYVCRALLFLGIAYIVTRLYIVNVIRMQDID